MSKLALAVRYPLTNIRLIREYITHINYLTLVTETALYTIMKQIESRNVSEIGDGGEKRNRRKEKDEGSYPSLEGKNIQQVVLQEN
jgi:hypothetical protein